MKKIIKNISLLITLNIKKADEDNKKKNEKKRILLTKKIKNTESMIFNQLYNLLKNNKNNKNNKNKKQRDKTFIPNYNTFSTIIDRLSVEHVKLHHFKFTMKNHFKKNELKNRLELQNKMIKILQEELLDFFKIILKQNNYNFLFEKRTFV
tara:strand:+ start:78 stop:530 length:453 start_codon:yes stop_codon:yes gene_type:complete